MRKTSYLYLVFIPLLAAIPAFTIGHISYKIYLPIWMITSILMLLAIRVLSGNIFRREPIENKHLAIISICLIVPWIFISIFFGMGPPPNIPQTWIERSSEQQTRYTILAFSGILIALGLGGLKEKLIKNGEAFYSNLGFGAIAIAIPLFLMYITLLHSFDFESFKIYAQSSSTRMPEWYRPIETQYSLIAIIEAALTYFATAMFALSIYHAGWFNKTASNYYIIISTVAFLLVVFYPLYAKHVAFLGIFPLLIPAIPFVMPYLIGVNLLRRKGIESYHKENSYTKKS